MHNIDNNGYSIIKSFFTKTELIQISDLVLKNFLKKNKSKIVALDLPLEKIHNSINATQVKYLSLSYGDEHIHTYIKKLIETRLENFIPNKIQSPLKFHGNSSAICVYPSKLSESNISFHQDDGFKKGNQKFIHAIFPITNQGLDNFQVIKKTHEIGEFKHTMFGPLLKIPDKELEDYQDQITDLKLEFGDMLLFYTPLIHRVKENHSDMTSWMARFIFNSQ